MSIDWLRILPDADYRFHMGLRQGSGAEFFSRSAVADAVLAHRAALLDAAPQHYVVLPGIAADAVAEAVAMMSGWCGVRFADARDAGRKCEADWVVLTPDDGGTLRVAAGIVCFPSSWSLPEKAGRPVSEVHAPVPGLNDSLGRGIDMFLSRLTPGVEWERDNWGLSADRELDHHPRRRVSALMADASLASTWLRLERQLFARLPCGGVLFAINVSTHPLDELTAVPGVAHRLSRALGTMPENIARYKGIAEARSGLVSALGFHR